MHSGNYFKYCGGQCDLLTSDTVVYISEMPLYTGSCRDLWPIKAICAFLVELEVWSVKHFFLDEGKLKLVFFKTLLS